MKLNVGAFRAQEKDQKTKSERVEMGNQKKNKDQSVSHHIMKCQTCSWSVNWVHFINSSQ